ELRSLCQLREPLLLRLWNVLERNASARIQTLVAEAELDEQAVPDLDHFDSHNSSSIASSIFTCNSTSSFVSVGPATKRNHARSTNRSSTCARSANTGNRSSSRGRA